MKKIVFILSLCSVFLMTGCGGNSTEVSENSAASESQSAADIAEENEEVNEEENEEETDSEDEEPAEAEEKTDSERSGSKKNMKFFPQRLSDALLHDNYSSITGENILFEDDDFIIRMTGDIQFTDTYTTRYEYIIPVKVEPKKTEYDRNAGFTVTEAVINDVVVSAYYEDRLMHYPYMETFIENPDDTSSYICLDNRNMLGLQQMLKEPAIKKMQINIKKTAYEKRDQYCTGEVLRSSDCPDSFEFSDRMKVVHSDEFLDYYYGGFVYVEPTKEAHYLFAKKAHGLGDGFTETRGSYKIDVDDKESEKIRNPHQSNSSQLFGEYSSPFFASIGTENMKEFFENEKFESIKIVVGEGYSNLKDNPCEKTMNGNFNIIGFEVDITDELAEFAE